ncbi:transposase [Paenibacillus contaminans]|uniref:Transposase IS4-like domain-containing protein n=1 Tax=Paenibacillus contaminans TaxID=450362 RepID=A0A329MNH7_9BACL|nr:hypothetical protein DQG23_09050 [Paenibacillus contaminans]
MAGRPHHEKLILDFGDTFHNGENHNEVRLIYVTQQNTGLPIYFRRGPGNVIDTSTLIRTINELKANGVNTKFAVLDAGYYNDENILALYEGKISFVIRLRENRKLYKALVAAHLTDMEQRENLVHYNGRSAYIKCIDCQLIDGHGAYAYIGLDIDRISRQGIFILVSSRRIAKDKILPTSHLSLR